MPKRWPTILATVLIAYLVAALGALAFIYAGTYDIAASDAHWGITRWVMETARVRSIKAHAAGIAVPAGLDAPDKIPIGVTHYAAHCAVCHGAPGVPKDDIAEGMYPQPPDLAKTASQYSDAELFWILQHGIKMTGMPSWADHSDDELWATVAFLRKLGAGMSAAEYGELVKANQMHGMQHHPGGETAPGMEHGGAAPALPHQH